MTVSPTATHASPTVGQVPSAAQSLNGSGDALQLADLSRPRRDTPPFTVGPGFGLHLSRVA